MSFDVSSSFLLFPRGAGSSGVLQYVTVRVTTWRTLTLPGLPLTSGSASRGEKDALHGAALSGDCAVLAVFIAGEYGDCGICSLRGVRADRGPGLTKGDGGIMMRGDSGRVLLLVELFKVTDCSEMVVLDDVVEVSEL